MADYKPNEMMTVAAARMLADRCVCFVSRGHRAPSWFMNQAPASTPA